MAEDNNGTESNAAAGPEGHGEAAPVARREAEEKPCKCQRHQNEYFSQKTKDIISLLTLIAVSLYTGITIALWSNGNEQLKVSRDTEKRSLRAYVIVNKIEAVTYGARMGDKLLWDMFSVIENTGNTPTKNFRMWGNTSYGVAKRFIVQDQVDWTKTDEAIARKALIGPKEEILGLGATTSSTDLTQIANGAMRVEMAGLITYEDVFDLPHRVEFCFAVGIRRADFENYERGKPIRDPASSFCPKHNCSDEECKAQ